MHYREHLSDHQREHLKEHLREHLLREHLRKHQREHLFLRKGRVVAMPCRGFFVVGQATLDTKLDLGLATLDTKRYLRGMPWILKGI